MKRHMLLLMVAALALCAPRAEAGYIGSTPANNDVIGIKEGWFGSNLYLIAGAATTITIDYIGKEAGFVNTFVLNGETLVTTGTTAPGATFNRLVNPGLISFNFGTPLGTVTNGTNTEPPAAPNFFISLGSGAGFLGDTTVNNSTPSSGTVAILALDDGGAGVDDNHDDLVVRLSITNGSFEQVPDGGTTLALLGSALVGLGAIRRRMLL